MTQKYLHEVLDTSTEVAEALANRQAVVALESTIIAHGMPYPQNVETALAVEEIIRKTGATPATIALWEGRLKAGLSTDEIDLLGKEGPKVTKCSRRDIPFVLQSKKPGATTVAATMCIAAMAGIRVFATGGIGGVHRGGALSMDVSADLQELARTSVAVVCAGAKAILDLGLSLEYLETQGVPVIGFRTDQFPAFYSRESGFGVDYRADTVSEIAEALQLKWSLGLDGGVVIANPIPEAYAMDRTVIDAAIAKALEEARQQKIQGKAITPFLLARVKELTGGASLEANIQLVYHNARVAAKLAKAFNSR